LYATTLKPQRNRKRQEKYIFAVCAQDSKLPNISTLEETCTSVVEIQYIPRIAWLLLPPLPHLNRFTIGCLVGVLLCNYWKQMRENYVTREGKRNDEVVI
jgi:hypothetical protein